MVAMQHFLSLPLWRRSVRATAMCLATWALLGCAGGTASTSTGSSGVTVFGTIDTSIAHTR